MKDKSKVQVKVNKDLEGTEDSKFSKNQDVPQALKEKSVRVTEIQSEHAQSIREKVHVPLGHGFFNKLGGSSVPVENSKLQKLYKELWCNTPNKNKQELSNSLILEMSHAKFENFTNQRALETWARKEKEKRPDILPAIHDPDDNLLKRPDIWKWRTFYGNSANLNL